MLWAISIKRPGFREINGDVYTAGLIHLAVFPEFHSLRLSQRGSFTPSGQIELNAWHLSAFKTQWPDGNNDGDQRKEKGDKVTLEKASGGQTDSVKLLLMWICCVQLASCDTLQWGFISVYWHVSYTWFCLTSSFFVGNNWAAKIDDQNYIPKMMHCPLVCAPTPTECSVRCLPLKLQ